MATYTTDPNVGTYDPKKMLVNMGTIPITGWASGDFITITTPEDAFTKQRGADGKVERTLLHVSDAEITLTLMRSSPVNDLLSALHAADRDTGAGKVPFSLKDLNSDTVKADFSQAWVVKLPDLVGTSGEGTREWRIDTGPGIYTPGSNLT